jgi:hypothetical protein
MPVIQALRRLKQKYHEFDVSLGYIARLYLRKTKKEKVRDHTEPQKQLLNKPEQHHCH